MASQNADISNKIAGGLETLLTRMINNTAEIFQDYDKVCEKKKETDTAVVDSKKESIKSNMAEIFKIIGRQPQFDKLSQGGLWQNKQTETFDLNRDVESNDDSDQNEQMPQIDPSESISGLIMGFKKSNIKKKPKVPEQTEDKVMKETEITDAINQEDKIAEETPKQ